MREQFLAGQVFIGESVALVPEWTPAAEWFHAPEQDADDDANCL